MMCVGSMTIRQILEQAKALRPHDRKKLAKLLSDMMDIPKSTISVWAIGEKRSAFRTRR